MTRLFCLFLVAAILLPHASWAKNAEIMMLPTRVVMEKNDRFSTVVIKNTGDATGDFNIDLVDMKMEETGMVVPYATGEAPAFSAIPYIHIAPKSVTLKPGESQNVRLLLRKPEGMEPGEYRSHVKVRLVNDNTDQPKEVTKDAVISVKANLVIVIPVIVRNGDTSLTMGIEQPKLGHDAAGHPTVDMYLTRQGNRSSMGDISVTCSQGGAAKVIKFFPGVSVYRPTTRRFISVPLDETPKDINLSSCNLGITYAAQQKEGGGKLAEATIGK
jgi:fimbrial chaperone protein